MARPEKGFQFFRRRGIMGLPHKGTETRCRPRLYLTTGFQLIPARGRKPINEPVFASQAVISTYPRKGTETSAISLDGEWMPISTYPRKGTETCYGHCTRNRVRRFQLIPARGRKLNGDNLRRNLTKFQLIPARGRKHKEDDSGFYFAELFQLIPARGRKHHWISKFSNMVAAYFNLSPQGDGNFIQSDLDRTIYISTYPRKGTETDQ